MKKALRILFLTALVSVLFALTALADTIGGGTVTADYLNLRTQPDIGSESELLIPNGGFLLIESDCGEWYQAVYEGREGYVSKDYVSFSETADAEISAQAVLTGDSVNLRAAPNIWSWICGCYREGTAFDVLGVSGGWVKVSTGSVSGYIRSDYLSLTGAADAAVPGIAAESQVTAASNVGELLAAEVQKYVGCRYVWGGMSPSGFDCSGLVNYVCSLYGISLCRVAQDIFSRNGTAVDKTDLQPGDLLFFGYGPYSITHVGMYIGNGQMVHASTSTTGVIVSDINSTYYTNMYQGARRVC